MADIVNMMMFVEHGKAFPAKLNIKGSVSAKSLIGYTEYTARDDSRDIDQDKEIEITDGYLGYTSREGSRIDDKEIRTFSSDGWIPADRQMDFRKKIAKYFCKDGDLAWIPVTSFKDYFTAEQYGLMNEEDYAAVMSNALPKFFNRVGLDPNNMIWWFDYHTNKNHPHTHLVFIEKEKTRTKGVFKQDDVNYFKGLIITEANKRLQLIKGISSDKTLFVEKDLMMNDVKRNLYDHLISKKDEKIDGAIKKLFDKMAKDMFKGRLQYGSSHIIPYRKDVDAIVNMVFAHPEVLPKLNEFTEFLKQFDEEINKSSNSDINTFSNSEVGKLKKQLANKVLSLKKDYVSEAGLNINTNKPNRSKQHLTRMDASPEELVNAYRHYDEKTDDVSKRILNSSKRIMKDEPELLGDILDSGAAGMEIHLLDNAEAVEVRPLFYKKRSKISLLLFSDDYTKAMESIYESDEILESDIKMLFDESGKGNPNATFELAKLMKQDLIEGDCNEYFVNAFDQYTKLNRKFNNGWIQCRLADMHKFGNGIEKNEEIAFHLYVNSRNARGYYQASNLLDKGLVQSDEYTPSQLRTLAIESMNRKKKMHVNDYVILGNAYCKEKQYENALNCFKTAYEQKRDCLSQLLSCYEKVYKNIELSDRVAKSTVGELYEKEFENITIKSQKDVTEYIRAVRLKNNEMVFCQLDENKMKSLQEIIEKEVIDLNKYQLAILGKYFNSLENDEITNKIYSKLIELGEESYCVTMYMRIKYHGASCENKELLYERAKKYLLRDEASANDLVSAHKFFDDNSVETCTRIVNSKLTDQHYEAAADIWANGLTGTIDLEKSLDLYMKVNSDWCYYKAALICEKTGRVSEKVKALSKIKMPLGKIKLAFHYYSSDRDLALILMHKAANQGDKFANEFLDDMNANNKLLANQPMNKAAVFSALDSIANAQTKVMQMMKSQDIDTYYEGKGIDHDS